MTVTSREESGWKLQREQQHLRGSCRELALPDCCSFIDHNVCQVQGTLCMPCAKGLRHEKEKTARWLLPRFLPNFLQITCFLDLGSCVMEPMWILHTAGEHTSQQVQQAPLLAQLETMLVLQRTMHVAQPREHRDKPHTAKPCRADIR